MISSLGHIQADYLMISHQKGSRSPLSLGSAWHCHRHFSANPVLTGLPDYLSDPLPTMSCQITCMQPAAIPSGSHFASIDRHSKGLDWPGCMQTFPAPWNLPPNDQLSRHSTAETPSETSPGPQPTATPVDTVVLAKNQS